MVVIIDDREDVWNFAPNLIHVRPYHFFQHTGDINAPPGLAKQEKDDKEGYDFTSINSGEKTSSDASHPEASNGSLSKDQKDEAKISPKLALKDVNCDSGTQEEGESKSEQCVAALTSSTEDTKQVGVTKNEENKEGEANTTELTKEDTCAEDERERIAPGISEKTPEDKDVKPLEECSKIHIHDTDDYLLHLQYVLRTIHHAYYELYDESRKKGEAVPDMKIVLPYARRKVLAKVQVVFSGVVPTNTPLEKSKPYLVARSLGADVMDRVSETTTHVIAARLGTVKVRPK